MTREEALHQLFAESSHQRFMAVHELSKTATSEDLPLLLRARQGERDAFVLKRLESVIALCTKKHTRRELPKLLPRDEGEDPFPAARAQAIDEVAGVLLHEIGSKLGLVAYTASKEVPNYDSSLTGQRIRSLQASFDAITQLRDATTQPRLEQFDLVDLIQEVINIEADGNPAAIAMYGMRPFVVTSGRHLLRLALCNGIRNAIEATTEPPKTTSPADDARVIVTWGATDRDNWISVIDHGPGIAASFNFLFHMGKTTKTGHGGFGLSIAKQALETLGGEVVLDASPAGGAKYEMRWKK